MRRNSYTVVAVALVAFILFVASLYLYSRSRAPRAYAMAYSKYETGNYREAIEKFLDVIIKYPSTVYAQKAYYYRGRSFEEIGMYERAIETYQQLISLYPGSKWAVKARVRLAHDFITTGEPERALSVLNEVLAIPALERHLPVGDVYAEIGRAYYAMGDYENALMYFKKASLLPSSDPTQVQLGLILSLQKLGKVEEALGLYQTWKSQLSSKLRPEQLVESYYREAMKLYRAGERERAREIFKKIVEQFPESRYGENALYWIGETYYDEGNYEKACEYFSKVLQNSFTHKDHDALYKLGVSLAREKKWTEAYKMFKKFLALYPDSYLKEDAREWLKTCEQALHLSLS